MYTENWKMYIALRLNCNRCIKYEGTSQSPKWQYLWNCARNIVTTTLR